MTIGPKAKRTGSGIIMRSGVAALTRKITLAMAVVVEL